MAEGTEGEPSEFPIPTQIMREGVEEGEERSRVMGKFHGIGLMELVEVLWRPMGFPMMIEMNLPHFFNNQYII